MIVLASAVALLSTIGVGIDHVHAVSVVPRAASTTLVHVEQTNKHSTKKAAAHVVQNRGGQKSTLKSAQTPSLADNSAIQRIVAYLTEIKTKAETDLEQRTTLYNTTHTALIYALM